MKYIRRTFASPFAVNSITKSNFLDSSQFGFGLEVGNMKEEKRSSCAAVFVTASLLLTCSLTAASYFMWLRLVDLEARVEVVEMGFDTEKMLQQVI